MDRRSRITRPASAKSLPRTAAAANSSARTPHEARAAATMYAGALTAVRNANAQLRDSLATALPTSAREAASEAMVGMGPLAVPLDLARCFMM